ncbi:ATP synthase F1 subunit delta [Leptospira santarosai]|uniref:ATP synthase F1 subunit delta n=2 Tax=Leptospira santarosai TaxID=28183 RepID=UPI0024AF1E9F|nr:ATP synthase F1 subunit delta [Leptospira santarosai]MDI7190509.1 ATP synthase F1 subunit delta [Leptospira santarosai]MDI7210348.1 ATP synthase F1 subunit delta [Leptospira santarosai]MDI7215653.1 ATP synthase F1 subunit delta [Leptospira santarosai]MDI7234885.1 ATP synthase F1 subunit delta [Leptospira santarosai]
MNDSGVSKIYASALLGATNSPEEVEQELDDLVRLLFQEEKIRNFFLSPTVSIEEKENILGKNLRGKISDIVLNFLGVLLNRGRIIHLPEIQKQFTVELDKKKGRVRAQVKSYPSLEPSQITKLESILSEKFKSEFILEVTEDKSLLGGFVVQFNDLKIEKSIASQLGQMKKFMLEKKLPVGAIYEN